MTNINNDLTNKINEPAVPLFLQQESTEGLDIQALIATLQTMLAQTSDMMASLVTSPSSVSASSVEPPSRSGKLGATSAASARDPSLPWDPNGETPDTNISIPVPMTEQQFNEILQRLEGLVQWLQQNPGAYNGYLTLYNFLVNIGDHYQDLKPGQQNQFNDILKKITSANGGSQSLGQKMVELIVAGKFYQTGGNKQATTDFAEHILEQLTSLSGLNPMFANMFGEAFLVSTHLNDWMAAHLKDFGGGHIYTVGDNKMPMDFDQFVRKQTAAIGSFLLDSDVQSWINNYYASRVNEIFDKVKDPFLRMLLLLNLLFGQDEDNSRVTGGHAKTLDTLKKGTDIVGKMLNLIKDPSIWEGPNADEANLKMIGYLRELKSTFEAAPWLKVSDLINTGADVILNMGVGLNPAIPMTYTVKEGLYTFPPGTNSVTINGQNVDLSKGKTVYLQGGDVAVTFGGGTSTISPAQLADMGGLDFSNGNKAYQNPIGFLLKDQTTKNDITNALTQEQTYLNSQAPGLNQQISTLNSTREAFQAFIKVALGVITTVDGTIVRNSNVK